MEAVSLRQVWLSDWLLVCRARRARCFSPRCPKIQRAGITRLRDAPQGSVGMRVYRMRGGLTVLQSLAG
jgi:hypothetical protein